MKVSEGYQSAGMGHMPIKRPENWQVYFYPEDFLVSFRIWTDGFSFQYF